MNARDDLRVPLALAWGLLGRPVAELDGLLDEYDTARRDELVPSWEAVYESATFTSRLLAYCQDEVTAKGAAEAWLREQCADVAGLVWTPDPQMAVREWDQWLSLSSTAENGTPLETEIVVRRRAARTTTAPTSQEH